MVLPSFTPIQKDKALSVCQLENDELSNSLRLTSMEAWLFPPASASSRLLIRKVEFADGRKRIWFATPTAHRRAATDVNSVGFVRHAIQPTGALSQAMLR